MNIAKTLIISSCTTSIVMFGDKSWEYRNLKRENIPFIQGNIDDSLLPPNRSKESKSMHKSEVVS